MAHDSSGHIFIQTVGGTTYGVEIADLQQVLGRGVNDLGLLCSDQEWDTAQTPAVLADAKKINWWARKKPVPLSGSTPVWNHPTSTWYMGKDGNFGIYSKTYFSVSDISSILADVDGGLNGWEYHKDTLAYRLRDFEGYFHNARNPFDGLDVHVETPQVAPGENLVVAYRFSATSPTASDEIGLEEIACEGLTDAYHDGIVSVADMYLALLVYGANGSLGYTRIGWAISDSTLSGLTGDAARYVQFPIPSSQATGDYIVLAMLCEVNTNPNPDQGSNSWTLIPGTSIMQFEVATTMLPSMSVEAYVFSDARTTVYFAGSFFGGTTTSSQTFNDITMTFKTAGGQTVFTVSNVQNENGSAVPLVVQNGATVRVPASISNWRTVEWPSVGMDVDTFIQGQDYSDVRSGNHIELSGTGADNYYTYLAVRPRRD